MIIEPRSHRLDNWVLALVLALVLSFAPRIAFGQRPIPIEQWDEETHVTLASAFIGEAGWEAELDWAGIAHVLARRWERAVGHNHAVRFVQMVKAYCAPLRGRPKNRRHRWLRALTLDGLQPRHWPAHRVRWDERAGFWKDALTRAASWARGAVSDPCRGRAWNFGGAMDPATGPRVWCGKTLNRFYAEARR